MFPILGARGRLMVAIALQGAFSGVPHAHRWDWVWYVAAVIGVGLTAWRAQVSMSSPQPVTDPKESAMGPL